MIPTYRQWGESWSMKRLGKTDLTVARYGCYAISLSMATANFGIRDEPGTFIDKMNAVGAFNECGMMTYDGVMRAYPKLYFYKRVYTELDPSQNGVEMTIDAAIYKVHRLVSFGQPTILCVDNLYNDGIPDHAVICYDAPEDTRKWRIKDPDGGHDCLFEERYGSVKDGLYGFVSIIGPPENAPDGYGHAGLGSALWKAAQIKQGKNVGVYSAELIDTLLI